MFRRTVFLRALSITLLSASFCQSDTIESRVSSETCVFEFLQTFTNAVSSDPYWQYYAACDRWGVRFVELAEVERQAEPDHEPHTLFPDSLEIIRNFTNRKGYQAGQLCNLAQSLGQRLIDSLDFRRQWVLATANRTCYHLKQLEFQWIENLTRPTNFEPTKPGSRLPRSEFCDDSGVISILVDQASLLTRKIFNRMKQIEYRANRPNGNATMVSFKRYAEPSAKESTRSGFWLACTGGENPILRIDYEGCFYAFKHWMRDRSIDACESILDCLAKIRQLLFAAHDNFLGKGQALR